MHLFLPSICFGNTLKYKAGRDKTDGVAEQKNQHNRNINNLRDKPDK